jgi:hypothetical protein
MNTETHNKNSYNLNMNIKTHITFFKVSKCICTLTFTSTNNSVHLITNDL